MRVEAMLLCYVLKLSSYLSSCMMESTLNVHVFMYLYVLLLREIGAITHIRSAFIYSIVYMICSPS